MISLLLDGVAIGFEQANGPGGVDVKILVVTDEQSGIQVRVPLLPEAQSAIARHLDGKPPIHLATHLNDLPPQP